MARRAKGEGSIYLRKDGRWGADFQTDHGTRTVYGKTQKEARQKLQEAQRDYERGRLVASSPQTLAGFLDEWLPVHLATGNLKPGTAYIYRSAIRLYIVPELGKIHLQKLTTEKIQKWLAGLSTRQSRYSEQHLAPVTIRRVYQVLHRALSDAMVWQKIKYNPCDGVRLPKSRRYQPVILTKQQARLLVEKAKAVPMLSNLILLAITTAAREGELIGLKWDDIDFEARKLQIRRTAIYLPDEKTGKWRHIETEPKSETSRRPITLPPFVVEALRAHKREQATQQLAAGPGWLKLGLVFCMENGRYLLASTIHKHFKRLLKDAGLPDIRFHDLRHSAATILLAMGVNIKVIQELLGHSHISTTLGIYGHTYDDDQGEAMRKLDDFYG